MKTFRTPLSFLLCLLLVLLPALSSHAGTDPEPPAPAETLAPAMGPGSQTPDPCGCFAKRSVCVDLATSALETSLVQVSIIGTIGVVGGILSGGIGGLISLAVFGVSTHFAKRNFESAVNTCETNGLFCLADCWNSGNWPNSEL